MLEWILRIVKGLISPTRAIVNFVKARQRNGGKEFIRRWHWAFFLLAAVLCTLLYLMPASLISSILATRFGRFCFCLVPLSRCNEIFIAFLTDALDHLKALPSQTHFSPVERIKFAARSYIEAALDFGVVYFVLPSRWFSQPFHSIIHAVYFSGVTITTVGYGDVTPTHPVTQLLALYEIAVGIVLVVITLGTYIGQKGSMRDREPEPMAGGGK